MTSDMNTTGRRDFFASVLMWTGVALGYGVGAFHFLRYLVPLGEKVRYRELFVGPADQLEVGRSRTVKAPSGETYVMARTPEGFRVLSNVCPHLGCRVHWKPEEGQFVCPCHMGIFDADGQAVSGPPAEAKQRLARLDTIVRGGSVFVLIRES